MFIHNSSVLFLVTRGGGVCCPMRMWPSLALFSLGRFQEQFNELVQVDLAVLVRTLQNTIDLQQRWSVRARTRAAHNSAHTTHLFLAELLAHRCEHRLHLARGDDALALLVEHFEGLAVTTRQSQPSQSRTSATHRNSFSGSVVFLCFCITVENCAKSIDSAPTSLMISCTSACVGLCPEYSRI